MESKIGFGVLGLGHIGMRHCQSIENNPSSNLIATADIDSVKVFPNSINRNSMSQLCSIEEVQVINICTPNGLHAEHAIFALNAGKHVVIEKPMALSAIDCQRIIELGQSKNLHIFCVMQNRYSSPSKWLKGLLDENKLGTIFQVQVNCFWNRDHRYYTPNHWHGTVELDGGPLFTQFSHFIDLLFWVFNDIQVKGATFSKFNKSIITDFEDSGWVDFTFNQGAIGKLHYSTCLYDQNFESSISILGEKGTVKIGGQYMNKVEYCHIENYTMPNLEPVNPPNLYNGYVGSASNHDSVIQNVVNTILGKELPHTSALDGKKVVDFIENVYKYRL
jgi:predicted dehydrogenase